MVKMPIKNILYVCTGNVFRSPVAEEMTRQLLKELNIQDIRVESAGMVEYKDTPLREEILELTRKYGIDLSAHTPRQVNLDLVSNADLILVFDAAQVRELKEKFPDAGNKTHTIKNYAGDYSGSDFEDLWRKPPEEFEKFIQSLRTYVGVCVNKEVAINNLNK